MQYYFTTDHYNPKNVCNNRWAKVRWAKVRWANVRWAKVCAPLEAYQDPPKYWGRYVDDALAVIKTAHIEPFTHHLNAQHTSIQWTSELEADGKLPMLDTLTTRMSDGSLKFSVYRKPTHTDQYLQFQSHQPMEHKIRTLTHRADTIISDPQVKNEN